MSSIWSIAKLEVSQYRKWLPFGPGSNYGMILLLFISLLVVSIYSFRMVSSPLLLFSCLTLLHIGLMGAIATFAVNFTIRTNMSHWWLLFPVSRQELMGGKVLGLILVGLKVYPYFLSTGLTTYFILVANHTLLPLSAVELISYLLMQFAVLLIGLPVIVGIGTSIVLFARGWAIIGLVPLTIISINIPFTFFGALLGIYHHSLVVELLSLMNLAKDLVWIVAIGYPISILLFVLSYRIGLRRAADATLGTSIATSASITDSAVESHLFKPSQKKRSTFRVLFQYEISRFAYFGQNMPKFVRILTAVVLLLFLIGGFFAAKSLDGIVILLGVVTMLGYMGVVFPQSILINMDLAKGNLSWWLLFPHSRFKLLAGRMLAQWVAVVVYVLAVLFAACVGVAVRLLISGQLIQIGGLLAGYLGRYTVLFLVATILNVMLFQVQSIVIKNWKTMFLFFPIYFTYPFGAQIFMRWVVPEHDKLHPNPEFAFYFVLLCSIGLPLALGCFYLGGKYLNAYFNAKMVNNRLSLWSNSRS